MSKKYCYLFTEGNAKMRELLGGKGANLAEMTNIGLPVPQGFTITTEACTQYYEDGRQINALASRDSSKRRAGWLSRHGQFDRRDNVAAGQHRLPGAYEKLRERDPTFAVRPGDVNNRAIDQQRVLARRQQ